jgi:hypothetical protein
MNSPDYERGYLDGRDDSRQTIAKLQRALTKALEENLRLRNGASASSDISALAESPENPKNSTTP